MKWKRTCQECGYVGFYQKPNPTNKKETWRDTLCRKCKSPSLDYGYETDSLEPKACNDFYDEV